MMNFPQITTWQTAAVKTCPVYFAAYYRLSMSYKAKVMTKQEFFTEFNTIYQFQALFYKKMQNKL